MPGTFVATLAENSVTDFTRPGYRVRCIRFESSVELFSIATDYRKPPQLWDDQSR